jgi:hypothetical protein
MTGYSKPCPETLAILPKKKICKTHQHLPASKTNSLPDNTLQADLVKLRAREAP